MRKLLVAAVTATALGTLGLTAPALAQSASHLPPASFTSSAVVGIPSSISVTHTFGTETCTVTATGQPSSVTVGNAPSVNHGCTAELEGVWTKAGTSKITLKFTASGHSVTDNVIVNVLAQPCETDAVGVGSDTITPLTDQLANNYNNTLPVRTACTTTPHYESWDAVNPISGVAHDQIPEKADCPSIQRPNGSSEGIAQLATFAKSSSGPLCTNFARSSRVRKSTDPPFAAGGSAFVVLAGDAISWATPAVNTFAPASLTVAQLNAIYTCTDTNWNQVGGGNHAITPFLPQNGSGTLATFLADIGVTTPGPCVSNNGNNLEENEGVNPVLNTAGVIFPYSVGDWIAQKFHGNKCVKSGCTANSSGVVCVKTPNHVQFWCDVHGTMTVRQINGIAPTTGTGTGTVINPAFPSTFDRTLFNVVPFDPNTADHIPGATSPVGGVNLEKIFGKTGYDCSTAGTNAIKAYGFVPLSNCGSTS